ncbi:MAG: hypothetical protein NT075_04885 [Chloroflexi bacterium]|nr:hypothetical protein [Chloroflexota bacterium]
MSTNPEILPAEYAWIVTDNLGKETEPSYENAVQVVRAQRQQ